MKPQVVDVDARLPLGQLVPLSLQHLFAMFGATVLVPVLTGMSPAVALFSSGAGTLLFILITGGQVPAYLGSSFAFIAPLSFSIAQWGLPYALGGAFAAGLVYAVVAAGIAVSGVGWLKRLLPPVVIGPVIMVIGLGLAPVALDMAGLVGDNVTLADPGVQAALITLALAIGAALLLRGWFSMIPVLVAVVGGYIAAYLLGIVDFSAVREAAWLGVPDFTLPRFHLGAITVMAPVAVVTMAEHLGDVLVLSRVIGRDFYEKPGLHRTLLGDGLATALASLVGGPPNTTYGENVGVMAITRVFAVRVIALTAAMAIGLSFVPKLGALIQTVPAPVMGGVAIVLFGTIAASGVRTLVESRVDLSQKRNLIIASVILVVGVGGAAIKLGPFELHGMALATTIGVILNLLLPEAEAAAVENTSGAPERAAVTGS
ncbi:MAG: solute carrier family 23 protein [Bacillota bacterium]|nr:uracil permease [Bacillota bacterium]REJ36002.1 MAG: uracil permease [Bacillota bacterium]